VSWIPRHPTDVVATLAPLRRGPGDPTQFVDDAGAVWRTTLTADGAATLRVTQRGEALRCDAWGPGAREAVASAPDLAGGADDPAGFDPITPLVAEAHRRNPGLRMPRSARVFEALVPAVIEQRVITLQAHESWRHLLHRFGAVAPGPTPRRMRVVPSPEQWARIPSWEWHRAGVDPARSRTIVVAARYADRLEEAAAMTPVDAIARLRFVPGIGEWTAAEIAQRAFGDPDALSVGDYHLSNYVGHAMFGRDLTDDEMLEALEPWRGHRQRVVRLLGAAGVPGKPRRAPRAAFVDHRSR